MSFKEFCRVLRIESEAISRALIRFDSTPDQQNRVQSALDLLLESSRKNGKVLVLGLGKSGKIAAKIAATLSSTGTPAVYVHPTEALHGDLGVVSPHDVAIAISYTGNTDEIVELLPYFEKRSVPVIALTGNPSSKLAERAKIMIDCSVTEEACAHNLAPTSSTTLTLAIGDALAISLMQARGFTAKDFAKNHPGGSLGRRLQLEVRDLMHPISKAPVVGPGAGVDEILALSTERKLGAVLVMDAQKLLGIITDGDLRRALSMKEKFFSLRAFEIMTGNPITVLETNLAYDALRLMEERESQISVLPVVNSSGIALGLLRIHDLVQTF
ncbi:MAG: KpsF/GutQ family sugar-phosphate isomerase [Bdellovibrionales bacterium]|nr:KpsF/GutQ family sugar-phosphate isomerase [Bdellovibrionales bacterium]